MSNEDFEELVMGCPKIKTEAPAHAVDLSNLRVSTMDKENVMKDRENHKTFILYNILNQEILELVDMDLPISQIYDKFKVRGFPVRQPDYRGGDMASFINQDSHRRIHEEGKENIWFSDP
jgi:hypothetical protein